MTDDYLWDGTGAVDPEVAELEELLGELRYDREWQPVARPRRRGLAVVVLAAAAGVAVLLAWSTVRQSTAVTGEHLAPMRPGAGASGTPKLVNPFANEPAPRSVPSGAIVDPFKGSPRAAHSKPKPEELLNPFEGKAKASAPAPPPPTGKDGLVDPWAAPAGKQSLGASDVTRVIARHRSEVGSACWRAVRDNAPDTAPKTARVVLTLRIVASGRVAEATALDPPGYPGLGSCVAGRARQWVFPPSASATIVNTPFVFSR